MIIVVMGVTGSGKSTIGRLLASRLSLPFIEGDDYHSTVNVEKMRDGIPLTDEDREPWLRSLNALLRDAEGESGAVLACSALKERYRQVLQEGLGEKILWIYLEGREDVLRRRMESRPGHFMPEKLLRSQLATLEKPAYAWCFSIEQEPGRIVNEIVEKMER